MAIVARVMAAPGVVGELDEPQPMPLPIAAMTQTNKRRRETMTAGGAQS